jgi:hypothetical protein
MNLRAGLLRLVRNLSRDRSERRRLLAAAVALLRQRRYRAMALGPLLRVVPTNGKAKLHLWYALTRSLSDGLVFSDVSPTVFTEAIRDTHAYRQAQRALSHDRNGLYQRGVGYWQLSQRWSEHPPERMVVFHHYDRRGFLPSSWQEALQVLQAAGWEVVVSSSDLNPVATELLESAGVQVVGRANVGLCLGAYRDLALLHHWTPEASRRLRSLVLCNDSNLLLQPPEALLAQLERWTAEAEAHSQPLLSGLTDSAQTERYHLQSFLLHANRALLQHPAWFQFWWQFSLAGSKEELINEGEVGLSQALLAAGIELRPAYPLVQGLLADSAMIAELKRHGICIPHDVNQTVYTWISLLGRGYPLVKKSVLFELFEQKVERIAMTDLAHWIPENRRELLARDIQQLFISRYFDSSPSLV